MKINKKEYRFTKKNLLVFAVAMVFAAVTVLSWATDLAPAESYNRYDHNYNGNNSFTDRSELYYNDGVYTRVEFIDNKVVIETYDTLFNITSSKKITEMPLNCYMGSYMGITYNFLVYGIDRSSSDTSTANTCCVVKYDKSWNELGKYYYQSTDQGIGHMDQTDFAENGDILYIEATQTQSNGHEFSICLEFNSSENTFSKSPVGESRSHRMSSYIMYDEDSLITVTHSDNNPRGIGITRTEVVYNDSDEGCRASIYRLPDAGSTAANFTGMTIGGILATDDNYLIVYSCMKKKYTLGELADNSSYIQLASVNKDALDVDIILSYSTSLSAGTDLTTLDLGTSEYYILCPYIVHWKDDKYVIMWDKEHSRDVDYVVYSDNTKTASTVKTLTGLSLSDVTPLSVDGNIIWYTTGDMYEGCKMLRTDTTRDEWSTTPTFYIFNPEDGTYATAGHAPKIYTVAEVNTTTEAVTTETSETTKSTESSTEQVTTESVTTEQLSTEATNDSKQIKAAQKKKAKISKVTNVKGRKIKVTMKKASGYKFQIKISTSKKFKKNVKTYKTSKTTYTAKKKFSKGKTYYVKVRTYKKINGTTYYGKWSAVKKVKIKK